MDQRVRPAPHEIRAARTENPKMRERDLAMQLGISEAELVAAHCGESVRRIEPRVDDLLTGLEAVGEVMALTRNESAVHEKIGVYDKVVTGKHNAMVLGENIDLRIFPKVWAHGFAVEKRDGDEVRHSLQFFDEAGEAVHKVHLRPSSDLEAYQGLVERLLSADQSSTLALKNIDVKPATTGGGSADELRERWSGMTDVHQFFGILKALDLSRHQAVNMVGPDYAWRLDGEALARMFNSAASEALPIMCFVGNRGCIQIHSGPVTNIKTMGPWLNVLDETFHLHLRTDHVRELWAVRKPTKDGHVTSIEAYGADEEMIIQFFGKRHEGEGEREDWRLLAEGIAAHHLAGSCGMTLQMTVSGLLRRCVLGSAALAVGMFSATAQDLPSTFADPSRIAAIGGSITEIVYALGEEGKLVARDSTSVYPEAALALPDVGYMRALSPEGVLSVAPTGILALEGSGPKDAIEVLQKASVPLIMVPDTFDRDGILEKIRVVGTALGAEENAAALVARRWRQAGRG